LNVHRVSGCPNQRDYGYTYVSKPLKHDAKGTVEESKTVDIAGAFFTRFAKIGQERQD
jgi:hypothetical protein